MTFCFFLLGQLREQLSYLKGDNFFRFTCSDCSPDGKEQYERLKLTWQQVSTKLFSRHQVGWPRKLGCLSTLEWFGSRVLYNGNGHRMCG